jgi:glycosyltransferase involved in cell wall biosynthesis
MIKDKKLIIVMPAYNSELTLSKTIESTPKKHIDNIILVDDGSNDNTIRIAKKLGLLTFKHNRNRGYGAALKTGFSEAIRLRADVIVVLHSDNQYTPALVNKMAYIIADNTTDVVIASRMLNKDVVKIMPFYRYIANKILTFLQNIIFKTSLTEYHTGYRAYNVKLLKNLNYFKNSDDFVFDNELLAQIIFKKFRISEISCPVKYDKETSSISIAGSIKYFFGVMNVSFRYLLHIFKLKKYYILSN